MKMPNHCGIEGCIAGYHATQDRSSEEKLASFHYPFWKPELLQEWIEVTNRKEWTPTVLSVICEKHFHRNALSRGKQRIALKWKLNPVPTICRTPCVKRPLTQPNIDSWRKPPKIRNIEADQFPEFQREEQIFNLDDIKEKHCPPGFQISISQDKVPVYKSTFDINKFPVISQAIQINKELKVKLSSNGIPAPLPRWFSVGHNAKPNKLSVL